MGFRAGENRPLACHLATPGSASEIRLQKAADVSSMESLGGERRVAPVRMITTWPG